MDELYPILEFSGTTCLALWLTGFIMRWIAAWKIRREFRSKGFLRPPSGFEWFHFLQKRHYNMFDDSIARLLFSLAHFCLIGLIVIVSGSTILVVGILLVKAASPVP